MIFGSEYPRAWRCRRRWHRWWPRTAPRYQISDLASIWRRLVHRTKSPSCCLFAMVSKQFWELNKAQLWELKRLILKKHRRWFQSSRVQCPLVKMSASWFLESTYLIWIFGSLIYSVKQPIERNSVGSENMSQIRTSAFHDHLDYRFIVLKNVQLRSFMGTLRVWGNKINMR